MAQAVREGQFFLLPMEAGQFVVGLVARAPRRGGVLLGYFFGPRRSEAPSEAWLNARLARNALLVGRFRDVPLFRGEWRTLADLAGFDRAQWPVPAFHRFEGSVTYVPGGSAVTDWRVEYGDNDLILPATEVPAQRTELELPDDVVYDGVMLAGAIAERLVSNVPSADDNDWR